MTALLERLLGRLPIGWLQLVHNRTRLAAAIAGVAFANILVFMQLGFLGALVESIRLPYAAMNADLIVSAADMNTLADASPLPRSRMFEALSVPGVASATPVYTGKIDWKQPDGTIRTLDVFGIDPAASAFRTAAIVAAADAIKNQDVALIDSGTRNVPRHVFSAVAAGEPYSFEAKGRTLNVVGTFAIGGGFSADGNLVVSDQTFLKLFPQRAAGAPNHILLRLEPGSDRDNVLGQLRAALPAYDSVVRSVEETVAKDQAFQTTQRPIGIVFGFGIVIGIMVGVIIVYQVLSTDVADHLREYATFKAIGYPQRFFLGIVFEEALILALLGFVPGVLIALMLYGIVSTVTGLPVSMPATRPILVLLGTFGMCALSGAIATRRLAGRTRPTCSEFGVSRALAARSMASVEADPAIVATGLNHWFGEGEARKQALFDVNLTIERGRLTVLLGASGSGKTTLLTLIGCLRQVQDGSVRLLGQELAGAHESDLVGSRRRLGFIFQAHNLHESLTALQNVRMGLEVHGPAALRNWRAACGHLLSLLGLGERLDYVPAKLSGGQKQRVAVARALVGNPDVVFADEPTAALDKESGLQVVRMLKGLGEERGTTTLMVTHDPRILDLADRIVTLEDGRIVGNQS